jgi:hypothetical protein
MPSGSGTVVLGGRTRRGSEPQSRIGKIPSSEMQKLARLDESTAIGHVCSVRRLLMYLIIRLPPDWRRDLFVLIRECRRLDW